MATPHQRPFDHDHHAYTNLVAEHPQWESSAWAPPLHVQATFSNEVRPYYSLDTPGLRPSHARTAGSLHPAPSTSIFHPSYASVQPHNPIGWNQRDSGQPAGLLNGREHESTRLLDEAEGGSVAWFGIDDNRGRDTRTFDGGFNGLGAWRPSSSNIEASARQTVGGSRNYNPAAQPMPMPMMEPYSDRGDEDEGGDSGGDSTDAPTPAAKTRKRRRRNGEPPRDEGQRKHSCHLCASKFARPSALQIHLLAHTKVKSHFCPTCDRAFAIPSNLRRHQKIHVKAEARRRQLRREIPLEEIAFDSDAKPEASLAASKPFVAPAQAAKAKTKRTVSTSSLKRKRADKEKAMERSEKIEQRRDRVESKKDKKKRAKGLY
ncbi:hypothetical protein RQP46_000576 [Phenoliferia psychrophenolica]